VNKEEFNGFIKLIDQAYPKQKSLNDVQKGFFWLAFKDEKLENCLKSLSSHTKNSEWKPQVCDIAKYLSNEVEFSKMFADFVNRQNLEVLKKNKAFMNVVRIIGEKRIRRMLESEYDSMEKRFVELYVLELNNKRYDTLPHNIKQSLVGICKK
jgi:hypothetical protein